MVIPVCSRWLVAWPHSSSESINRALHSPPRVEPSSNGITSFIASDSGPAKSCESKGHFQLWRKSEKSPCVFLSLFEESSWKIASLSCITNHRELRIVYCSHPSIVVDGAPREVVVEACNCNESLTIQRNDVSLIICLRNSCQVGFGKSTGWHCKLNETKRSAVLSARNFNFLGVGVSIWAEFTDYPHRDCTDFLTFRNLDIKWCRCHCGSCSEIVVVHSCAFLDFAFDTFDILAIRVFFSEQSDTSGSIQRTSARVWFRGGFLLHTQENFGRPSRCHSSCDNGSTRSINTWYNLAF